MLNTNKNFLLLALLCGLGPCAALAQPSCYENLLQKGQAKYDNGLYADAILRWQAALDDCPELTAAHRETLRQKIAAARNPQPVKPAMELPEMVLVQGGNFQMGSNDGSGDEKLVHTVSVGNFYLAKYELTLALFKAFIDATAYTTDAEKENSSKVFENGTWVSKTGVNWRCDAEGKIRPAGEYKHPVLHVSWNDATAYCAWLSKQTGQKWRLPTEAEWEYAARSGGKVEKWAGFNEESQLARYANFCDSNCGFSWKTSGQNDGYALTAPVGRFQPNGLGLYDMSGNVWEWCSDWYDSDYYKNSPAANPAGPATGSLRVCRGGSWDSPPPDCRTAFRAFIASDDGVSYLGFRPARSP